MKKIIYLSLLCLLLAYCKPAKIQNAANIETITIHQPGSDSLVYLSALMESVKIIPLEYNKLGILGKIRKMEIYKDNVYIQVEDDHSKIYAFDMEGNSLNTIGSWGKGSAQHQELTDFDVDEKTNTVTIYDAKLRKMFEFKPDGTYIGEHSIREFPADNFAIYNDMVYLYRMNPSIGTHGLNIYNDYNLMSRYFPTNPNHVTQLENSIFSEGADNGLLFHLPSGDTIFLLKDEKLHNKYYVDFGKHKVSKFHQDQMLKRTDKHDPMRSVRILNENDYATGVGDICDVKSTLFFTYVYGNIVYYCFYNKENHTLTNSLNIIDDLSYLYFKGPLTSYNNSLVSAYDPGSIPQNIKRIERLLDGDKIKDRDAAFKTLEMLKKHENNYLNTNPFLLVYKMRE